MMMVIKMIIIIMMMIIMMMMLMTIMMMTWARDLDCVPLRGWDRGGRGPAVAATRDLEQEQGRYNELCCCELSSPFCRAA